MDGAGLGPRRLSGGSGTCAELGRDTIVGCWANAEGKKRAEGERGRSWAALGCVGGKGRGGGLGRFGLLVSGFGWAGFWVPSLFYFYFKQSLNSNTNLNSNHTQIIKTMHQHECNIKI